MAANGLTPEDIDIFIFELRCHMTLVAGQIKLLQKQKERLAHGR